VPAAGSGYVAVLVIDLHFPLAASLKAKRHELASIKAQLAGRLGLAVAETEFQDLWQRARLTGALTAGSASRLDALVDRTEGWLHARLPDGVSVQRLVLSVEDLLSQDH
jgi:uncharacterized protein YlxP (DUF503 family)